MSQYLSSKELYTKSYGDYLLYEAASQSLDLTIQAFGEHFDKAFQDFCGIEEKSAEEECAATAVFL